MAPTRQRASSTPAEIKTFYPTMEEFQNFPRYIQHIEAEGGHLAGICKVVPPREWRARRQPCTDEFIGDCSIPDPIEQRISGKLGVYDVSNYVQDPTTVREYRAESLQMENQPPLGPDVETEQEYMKRIERHFWKNVCFRPAIYGADVNGTLTDPDCTAWNINKLGTILDSVLAAQKISIRGVNTAYIYYGRYKAAFPWHTEDQDLYSINLIHYGAPKLWYAVPIAHAKRFEALMNTHYPAEQKKCKAFLRHKRFLLSPSILKNNNIPYNTMLHKEGEIMLTFPNGYHAGFNCGFNVAESTNFATERWIDFGMNSTHCYCSEDTVNIDMSSFLETYNKDFGGSIAIPADLTEKQDKDEDAALEALEKYDVDADIYEELSDASDDAEALVERASREDDDYVPNRGGDEDYKGSDYKRKRFSKRRGSQHGSCASSGGNKKTPSVVRHRMGGMVKYQKAPASLSASAGACSSSAVDKKRSKSDFVGKHEHLVAGFTVSEAFLIAAGDDDDSNDEDWKTSGDETAHLRSKRNINSRNSNSRSPMRRRHQSSPITPSKRKMPSISGFVLGSPPKDSKARMMMMQNIDDAVIPDSSPVEPKADTKRKRRGRGGATVGKSRSPKRNRALTMAADESSDAAEVVDSKPPSLCRNLEGSFDDADDDLPPTIERIQIEGPESVFLGENKFESLPYANGPPKISSTAAAMSSSGSTGSSAFVGREWSSTLQQRHCGMKQAKRRKGGERNSAVTKVSSTPRRCDGAEKLDGSLLNLLEPTTCSASPTTSATRDLAGAVLAAPEQKVRPVHMSPLGRKKKSTMLKMSGAGTLRNLKELQSSNADSLPKPIENVWAVSADVAVAVVPQSLNATNDWDEPTAPPAPVPEPNVTLPSPDIKTIAYYILTKSDVPKAENGSQFSTDADNKPSSDADTSYTEASGELVAKGSQRAIYAENQHGVGS